MVRAHLGRPGIARLVRELRGKRGVQQRHRPGRTRAGRSGQPEDLRAAVPPRPGADGHAARARARHHLRPQLLGLPRPDGSHRSLLVRRRCARGGILDARARSDRRRQQLPSAERVRDDRYECPHGAPGGPGRPRGHDRRCQWQGVRFRGAGRPLLRQLDDLVRSQPLRRRRRRRPHGRHPRAHDRECARARRTESVPGAGRSALRRVLGARSRLPDDPSRFASRGVLRARHRRSCGGSLRRDDQGNRHVRPSSRPIR